MKVNNLNINYKFTNKRIGDVESSYTNPSKALIELGWKTKLSIDDMCRDSWNYVKQQNISNQS
jgi:UDP-glucose 4-epimerase